MNRFVSTTAALAMAGLALAGCNKKNSDNAASSGGSAQTLTLVATNFQFDQTDLTAKAGDITFVVKNQADGTDHNLTLEDLKVNKDVKAGKTEQQTVKGVKAGTYQYHCEYHPTQMKGTLTVS